MSAEVEIRECSVEKLDAGKLIREFRDAVFEGPSSNEFLVCTESRTVTGHIEKGARTISFVGSYSDFTEPVFDLVEKISSFVEGQIFVEGEPWQRDGEAPGGGLGLGGALLGVLAVVAGLIAWPFIMIYLVVRFLIVGIRDGLIG